MQARAALCFIITGPKWLYFRQNQKRLLLWLLRRITWVCTVCGDDRAKYPPYLRITAPHVLPLGALGTGTPLALEANWLGGGGGGGAHNFPLQT